MRALLLLVLAACSFDAPSSTTTGDGGGGGGDGGTDSLIAPPADAAIDALDDLDDDDDGIADLADNCPARANPDQANEDSDLDGGDVCDRCPHLAAAQIDSDGDGIGNDCDPRPTLAGDQLVQFEGFNEPGAPPTGWTALSNGGTWSVSGGALRVTAGDTAAELVHAFASLGDHTVDARATILQQGSGIVSAAVLADVTTSPVHFYLCATRTDQAEAELWRYTNPNWTDFGAAGGGGGTDLRLLLRSAPALQTCRINAAELTTGSAPSGGNRIGVRARNMAVAFTSVAVYRSP